MSRKRAKSKQKSVEAVPDEILAEGSGGVEAVADTELEMVSAVGVVEALDAAVGESSDVDAVGGETDEAAIAASVCADAPRTRDDVVEMGTGEAHDANLGDAHDASLGDAHDASSHDASSGEAIGASSHDASSEAIDASSSETIDASSSETVDASSSEAIDASEPGLEAGAGEDPLDAADDVAGATLPTSAATMDAVQLKHLVEALVFASDKPVTIQRLRQLTRVSEVRRLEQALAELTEDYKDRGLIVQQVSGGYQFRTRTQFSAWVQQLIVGRPVRLSRAQLESLAIIAYRQPITRPEIDEIRGVDSSATLKLLMDRSLIRILGKREEAGRPMLYGTTREFLDFFSLGDLRELPTLREYSELTDESRKVMSDRLGVGLEPAADTNVIFDSTDAPDDAPVELDDVEVHADGDHVGHADVTDGEPAVLAYADDLNDAHGRPEGAPADLVHGGDARAMPDDESSAHALPDDDSRAHGMTDDDPRAHATTDDAAMADDASLAHAMADDASLVLAMADDASVVHVVGDEPPIGKDELAQALPGEDAHDRHVASVPHAHPDHDDDHEHAAGHDDIEPAASELATSAEPTAPPYDEPEHGDPDALASIAARVLAKADAAEAAEVRAEAEAEAEAVMVELVAGQALSEAVGDPVED